MFRKSALTLCLSLTFVVGASRAFADAAADAAAAQAARFAAMAQYERENAARVRDSVNALAADTFRLGGFATADLAKLKAVANDEALINEKIAAAYERGNVDEIHAAQKLLEPATRARVVWRDRITEPRKRQCDAAPTEAWYNEGCRYSAVIAMAQFNAWGEARKAASEAWGRVADATLPDADPGVLFDLTEQAHAADAEREIAELRYTFTVQRERFWIDSEKFTTDELVRRDVELRKVQEARLLLRRTENEQARKVRETEQSIRVAEQSLRKSLEAAQLEYAEREKARAAKK